jgi:hypothetical protein
MISCMRGLKPLVALIFVSAIKAQSVEDVTDGNRVALF